MQVGCNVHKQKKAAQTEADLMKVTENSQKAARAGATRDSQDTELTDTDIVKLTKDNLKLQLDWHRELEQFQGLTPRSRTTMRPFL